MNEKEIWFVRMEVRSTSSSASSASKSLVAIIREMKHDLKMLQNQVNAIDNEGGRRLDNVDKDLAYLWKKISAR